MGWLVRFWYHVILGREPSRPTIAEVRMTEEMLEQRIAQARYYGLPPEQYEDEQAMLDQLRLYRSDGLLP